MATCAYCRSPLDGRRCRTCRRRARDAESIAAALDEALAGRYEFHSILGSGGFAEVYRARDTLLDRDVAIKRLKLDALADEAQIDELRRRAVREARVAARLSHPRVVRIYDVVDRPDGNFIVMELIEGRTLEQLLRERKRLGFDETVRILAEAADALDYAHSQTVVHRDIKPGNIMLDEAGRVTVMDFGIAKREGSQEITSSGNILGTPNYMSPEQARGRTDLDAKTDIFSLGCIAYECLAGEKPFQGGSAVDVLMKIVGGTIPRLDAAALGLPDEINEVLARALAKDPAERFASCGALARALAELPRTGPPPTVAPAEPVEAPGGASSSAPVVTRRDPETASAFDLDLQGELSARPVAEIFRLVYTGRKTGILHLSNGKVTKRVYFRRGTIVFANSDAEEDKLGARLVREGVIDARLLDLARTVMRDTGHRLGRTLVELGSFDDARLRELVEAQVRDIVDSVFLWREGHYGFELLTEPVESDIAVEIGTMQTILDNVRRIDDAAWIRRELGDTSRRLELTENPLLLYQTMALTPSEGYVLSRVDGSVTIDEITAISPLGEEETLRCILALVAAGVVEIAEKPPTTRRRVRRAEPPPAAAASPEPAPTPKLPEGPGGAGNDETAVLDDIATKHASLASASLYELLEIEPTADAAAVKRGYYAMVKKYHPDRHQTPRLKKVHGLLEEIFVHVHRAYERLSDPTSREEYDRSLSRRPATPPEAEPAEAAPPAAGAGPTPAEARALAAAQYRAAKQHFAEMAYYDAIQFAREAIRLDPTKARYHRILAHALAKNPKWAKEAEAHYLEALELDEMDAESLLGLAELYESSGLETRARRLYRKVLDVDPDNALAAAKLGEAPSDSDAAFGRLRHLTKLIGPEGAGA